MKDKTNLTKEQIYCDINRAYADKELLAMIIDKSFRKERIELYIHDERTRQLKTLNLKMKLFYLAQHYIRNNKNSFPEYIKDDYGFYNLKGHEEFIEKAYKDAEDLIFNYYNKKLSGKSR